MKRGLRLYSMVTLVVAGFALVALPLLIAVFGGVVYLDRLASRSERLVREGVAVTRASEALESQLLQMERNAQRYRAQGGAELADRYAERHAQLERTLSALNGSHLGVGAADARTALRAAADSVATAVAGGAAQGESMAAALARFERMRALAGEIERAAKRAIRDELGTLERRSEDVRAFLFWQTVALVPVTIVLVGVFSWLILRPIGHLGRAVRSLGAVDPPAPVAVGGPPEIRALGDELERLRGRLERSEAEKTRFLRHISHELKTPLASIREGTELIADGSVATDTQAHAEVVEILRGSSVELQQLIENLLVLTARNLSQRPEDVDPGSLVDEALRRHRLAIQRRGLAIDRDVGRGRFKGFRPLIQSALSNLIGNAIGFSPEGGTLHVRAAANAQRLVVEVADEGPGIPESDRPHVFEPFFQGASPATGRGTGVGLSVVRDCARAHDGRVEIVDGEFPGAHVRLTLHAQHQPRPGAIA